MPEPGGVLVALLAAGRATRFGGAKLDAPCAGKPLGAWAMDAVAAAGLPAGIVVTGPRAPRFLEQTPGWTRIANFKPAEGLSGSLAIAARAAARREAHSMLILLADMPLVPATLIAELAARPGPAAIDHGEARAGVPALIPRALFTALTLQEGDRGAAPLLQSLADLTLIQPSPHALHDVDTPDDLLQAERWLLARDASRSPC